MKRKIKISIIGLLFILLFVGCQKNRQPEYTKYSDSFFDTFDTMTRVVGYTKSEEEFNSYLEKIHSRFLYLHKLYDIYNDYEGINNIKTINDNAGIKPVKVDKEIIDLIVFAKDWYKRTGGRVNIAMGSVLNIWHEYREQGMYDPQNAKLPPMEDLLEAAKHTDIDNIVVDIDKSTVYLSDKNMSINVGAVAKGYATEIVAQEIMNEGLKSGIISAGGNIRVLGKPLDGIRKRWGIGIQDPDKLIVSDPQNTLDVIYLNNASVVSSGDYQRYYVVDGNVIHHIIDPDTLMPGEYYRAVTVLAEDAGVADFLSTAVFLMPYEEGRLFVDSLEGVEAIWIMKDKEIKVTDGMKKIMHSFGATGAN